MGLSPETLHATTPGLVVVRLSGWGQTGPYRDLPGFGSLVEGFCGFADKHRHADGTPGLPNMALADMVTGLTGAFAVMAALREVEVRGGRGQAIDLTLLESMLAIMGPDATNVAATGRPAETLKIASPRGTYRCADGAWVSLSGSTDTMARRVFEAIGKPELIDDPRFSTNAARLRHDVEVDGNRAGLGQGDGDLELAVAAELDGDGLAVDFSGDEGLGTEIAEAIADTDEEVVVAGIWGGRADDGADAEGAGVQRLCG
jgi:crotonobetainyl-CoA:carnitine CoA-transferase CaiB-like acyl-CoA transferase